MTEDISLSASEVACYKWPEDTKEARALRVAFIDGATYSGMPLERPGKPVQEFPEGESYPGSLDSKIR